MAVALLTTIAAELKTMLEYITVAHGYGVTFGSVNQPDMALMTYPSADITYTSENIVGDDAMAQYGFCDVEFQIKLRVKHSDAEEIPQHEIDADMDTLLDAVKTKFGINSGALAITNKTTYIVYKGFEKEFAKSGDVFIPGVLITKWNVRYQN
jgi:hypothetical protein